MVSPDILSQHLRSPQICNQLEYPKLPVKIDSKLESKFTFSLTVLELSHRAFQDKGLLAYFGSLFFVVFAFKQAEMLFRSVGKVAELLCAKCFFFINNFFGSLFNALYCERFPGLFLAFISPRFHHSTRSWLFISSSLLLLNSMDDYSFFRTFSGTREVFLPVKVYFLWQIGIAF